ncbi:hypothetical protein AGMMS49975_02340 [Clostridia bacterium]|nr:hypothetical protein AGMMS49975_02340 [Clostridia bacterium]
MDGKHKFGGVLRGLGERIMSSDTGYDKPKGIAAGFVSVCDFAESGEIIANLAYLLAKKGIVVCIADFKVFYPNLFDWIPGVSAEKQGDGLIRLLNNDRAEVKSAAQKTDDENIFLVSPSPNDDIEDYLNFSVSNIKRVISTLKETFDVVLIDIPNNPPFEFCLASLMSCHHGFFVASERVDAPRNIEKLLNYALSLTDEVRSFCNIIISRRQGLLFEENAFSGIRLKNKAGYDKLRVAAKLPFLPSVQESALSGELYLRDAVLPNKEFSREINKISDLIGRDFKGDE